jgi:hypothetical protein
MKQATNSYMPASHPNIRPFEAMENMRTSPSAAESEIALKHLNEVRKEQGLAPWASLRPEAASQFDEQARKNQDLREGMPMLVRPVPKALAIPPSRQRIVFERQFSRGPVRANPHHEEAFTPARGRSRSVDYQLNRAPYFEVFPEGKGWTNVKPEELNLHVRRNGHPVRLDPVPGVAPSLGVHINTKQKEAIECFKNAKQVQTIAQKYFAEFQKSYQSAIQKLMKKHEIAELKFIAEGSSATGYKGPQKLKEGFGRVPAKDAPDLGLFKPRDVDDNLKGFYPYKGDKEAGFDMDMAVVFTKGKENKWSKDGLERKQFVNDINELAKPFFAQLLADKTLPHLGFKDPEMDKFVRNEEGGRKPFNESYSKKRHGERVKDNIKDEWQRADLERLKGRIDAALHLDINLKSVHEGCFTLGTVLAQL